MIIAQILNSVHSKRRNKKNFKSNEESTDEQLYHALDNLRKRLNNIRKGHEKTPLQKTHMLSLEDQEILNLNSSKRDRYGIKCSECHKKYRERSGHGRAITVYLSREDQIDTQI